MGTDRTGTYLTAIVQSLSRDFWPAESGYYNGAGARLSALQPMGPRTGYPTPIRDTALALRGHGEQEYSETLRVRCTRGGLPVVDSVGLIAYDTTSSSYRGCDPPVRPHTWAPIRTEAGHRYPHAIVTREDTVVVVYRDTAAGEIQVDRRAAGGITWGGAITVSTDTTALDTGPTILRIPVRDVERLLILWLRSIGTDYQVASAWSDDDGLTWTAGPDVLAAPLAGATYENPHRLRACALGGQVLLLGHFELVGGGTTWDDVLVQWASSDGGTVFDLVSAQDGSDDDHMGGWPDLISLGDILLAGYLAEDASNHETAYFVQISDAWQIVWQSDLYGSTTSSHYSVANKVAGQTLWTVNGQDMDDGDLALWADSDGHVYMTGRDVTTASCPVLFSSDRGHTWESTGADPRFLTGGGEVWWDQDDAQETAEEFTAVATRSQTLMITGWKRAAAISGHLASLTLGGMSTVTLPHRNASLAHTRRTGWEILWQSSCLPASGGYFTEAGAGGSALGSDVTTVTGAWTVTSINLTNALTDGVILEIDYDPSVLGIGYVATGAIISDGGAPAVSYNVEVRVSALTVVLWDINAGAAVATINTPYNSRQRVLLAVRQVSGAGYCQAWITTDFGDDAVWTRIGRSTNLTAAATATTYVWHAVQNGDTSIMYSFHAVSSSYTGDGLVEIIDEEDLCPRGITHEPNYLLDGASVSAVTGPGIPGDSWTLTPTAEYPVSACDPREVASPHIEMAFNDDDFPANTASVRVAWQWDAADTYLLSRLLGVYLDGLTSPGVYVQLYYSGAWATLGTVPTDAFQIQRQGKGVTVDSAGAALGAYKWSWGECQGWGCSVQTTAGVYEATTTIAENSQGSTLRTSSTALWSGLLTSDTGVGGATRVLTLWPSRALMVSRLASIQRYIRGIRLVMPVSVAGALPGRPSDGIYRCGVLHAGPALVVGPRCGQVHAVESDPQVEVEEGDDGTTTARERGEHRTSYTLVWPDPGVAPINAAPDYLSAGDPVAFAWDWLGPLDMVRQLRGGLYPVVAIPSCPIPTAGAPTTVQVERWTGAYYGRITGIQTADTIATGEEGRTDAARISEIQIRGEG